MFLELTIARKWVLTGGHAPRRRRATCYLQTLRYRQAISDFKKLLTLEPQNQLVRMQLDSTQKIMRKVEFEKVCFFLSVDRG